MCGPQTGLPEGWTAYVDAEGRMYYANSITGESSWTKPEVSLPSHSWSAHLDAEGRTYYANAITGESSWTLPTEEPIQPDPRKEAAVQAASLPAGWSAHQDAEGRTFYANAYTGESSWNPPGCTAAISPLLPDPPKIVKEFGMQRINTAAAAHAEVDQGTYASRLEERLMCGGFFQQIDAFVKQNAYKINDPHDGSGHSFDSFNSWKEYETMLSARCEHFLVTEGLSAEDVVNSMLQEEDRGKKFKSSEYLMAAIDFEMFVSLMLDFKAGHKDVSRWKEMLQEEADDWYNYYPAE